ncbi:MAG: arginine--tRNA ligase [Flavobacteriales bacterium]
MMIEKYVANAVESALQSLQIKISDPAKDIVIQPTRIEFDGDFSLVCFGLSRFSGKNPEETARLIGDYLIKQNELFDRYSIIKGFLNLSLKASIWLSLFENFKPEVASSARLSKKVMIEYSSPNTNKPLHLGHIRNNLLGYSLGLIHQAAGNDVHLVNLINDRGIHICKSMLAWMKEGDGETPESSGIKGDHLVGKYYVLFDKHYKQQIEMLMQQGMSKEDAEKQAPWMLEAQELLRKWEKGDETTINLWRTMNGWVYAGFDQTYHRLGVKFDKIYYESETYLLGKDIIEEGLIKGVFFKKEDGSVWIDLTADGLDQKLVLRADGTSVYITQDIGTAVKRNEELHCNDYVYVVGSEQEYHFKVLKLILKHLGYDWSDGIYHLSYGMVDLPSGKMKSREGTVVDADDLMDEVIHEAKSKALEIGKTEVDADEDLYRKIGLAALKYYILKVDPKKKMLFNPAESIDINGHTGPFIQYAYARICSLKRKALEQKVASIEFDSAYLNDKRHLNIVKKIMQYQSIVIQAAQAFSPALLANYLYELAKEFNQFYHDFPVLKEQESGLAAFRLLIAEKTGETLLKGMGLLGIEMPESM